MNSVLLSVRPQWCELIANGKKTIEVRKTRPKLETPFKCYIYCTAPKKFYKISEHMATSAEYLHLCDGKVTMSDGFEFFGRADYKVLNRKVIGEFVCDHITNLFTNSRFWLDEKAVEQACLTGEQIREYANGKDAYGWHISALQIYDKPKELSEFHFPPEKYCEKELCGGCPKDQVADVNGEYAYDCEWRRPITRAPQSWCYVEEYDGKR